MRSFPVQTAQKSGFDWEHDYSLIVSSFAAAYGLRIRSPATHIPWPEFLALLTGMPGSAPLPQMIAVRQATEKEAEQLGEAARQARADWQLWLAEQSAFAGRSAAAGVERVFQILCGGPSGSVRA